jgi:hypothetical protein
MWVIGFTGHRHIPDGPRLLESIGTVLKSLSEKIPGRLVGYSSVAIGSDSLFAQACLRSEVPWVALLPRSESDFKTDFKESDWEKSSVLLRQAARVQTLSSAEMDRDRAYLECGLLTVDEADVVMAAWDGQPARGIGGTADIVAHARSLGKPLIVVNPHTFTIEWERFSTDVFSTPEMDYLNGLQDQRGPSSDQLSAQDRIRLFFSRVDATAARIAPRFRGWVAASVIMNALSAILGTATIIFALQSVALNTLIFILMAAATVAVLLIKRRAAHQKWIRCRVASEICRSVLSTWELNEVSEPVWFDQLPGFGRLVKTIRLLKMTDRKRDVPNLAGWRQKYLAARIDDQINYFRRRRRNVGLLLAVLTFSFWIFSALGIARTLVTSAVSIPHSSDLFVKTLQAFLPIALPLAAGCALSLISIFDLNRQLARARAMQGVLEASRLQVEKSESLPTLRRAVENTENAFAGEVFEWFTLFRYPRFN